jgi:hypothetical protein
LRTLPLSIRKAHLERLRHAGRTASSSAHLSKVRSVPISSAPPATWGSRAWSRSVVTALIAADAQRTGLR